MTLWSVFLFLSFLLFFVIESHESEKKLNGIKLFLSASRLGGFSFNAFVTVYFFLEGVPTYYIPLFYKKLYFFLPLLLPSPRFLLLFSIPFQWIFTLQPPRLRFLCSLPWWLAGMICLLYMKRNWGLYGHFFIWRRLIHRDSPISKCPNENYSALTLLMGVFSRPVNNIFMSEGSGRI